MFTIIQASIKKILKITIVINIIVTITIATVIQNYKFALETTEL